MVGSLNWISRRDGHGDDFLYVKNHNPPQRTLNFRSDLNSSLVVKRGL